MKRLYKWIGALIAPVVLYMVIFYLNDPHSYFYGDANDSTLMGKMLDFRNNDYDAIILGDSKVDGLDVAQTNAATGCHYKNMAYGGCMSTEMISLFRWCVEQNADLKQVIFETSFYNMNKALQQDRVSATEKVIKNPLTYAFCIDNLSDGIEKLRSGMHHSDQIVAQTDGTEHTEEQKAANFETHLDSMSYYLDNFELDESLLQQFGEIQAYCTMHSIELLVVLPPWWRGFYDALDARGLSESQQLYKEKLAAQGIRVLDFENRDCGLSDNYGDFTDYAHFHGDTFEEFWLDVLKAQQ